MKLKHYLFAAALAVTATQAQAQGFSDTSMGVRDSVFASNPGGGKGSRDVNKVIVNVGHFDVWDLVRISSTWTFYFRTQMSLRRIHRADPPSSMLSIAAS